MVDFGSVKHCAVVIDTNDENAILYRSEIDDDGAKIPRRNIRCSAHVRGAAGFMKFMIVSMKFAMMVDFGSVNRCATIIDAIRRAAGSFKTI